MDRYQDTNNPKNPPQAVTNAHAQSAVLWGFVGSLVVFFVLVGVALVFWTVAHPRPHSQEGLERITGAATQTDGGHDPLEHSRPRTTQQELRYKGKLTPPTEVRDR